MIEIEQKPGDDPMVFNVVVSDSAGSTQHRVTLSDATYQRLTGGKVDPTGCVESAFKFLLEREPNTSILREFDLEAICRYFPEFETEITAKFAR